MKRERGAFAGVVLGFLFVVGLQAVAIPPCAVVDEQGHVQYAEFVRRERRPPDPFVDRVWSEKHPPLYYAVAAVLVSGVERLAPLLPERIPLPGPFVGEVLLSGRWRSLDGSLDLSGASLLALRGFSVLCALLGLIFIHRCVRSVLPEAPQAAAGALAFFAFNPRFLLQSGVIGNDAASVASSSVAAWFLLRGLLAGKRYRAFLAGLFAGLAFLVKVNCVFLLPAGLAVAWVRGKRGVVRPWAEAGLFVGGWALLAGPWVLRNLLRFGEPLGVGGQVANIGMAFFPGPTTPSLVDQAFGGLLWSFWEPGPGMSAGRVVTLACAFVAGCGFLGALLRLFRRALRAEAPEQVAPLLVSLFAGAFLYALIAAGNLSIFALPGRLLFPAIPFYAVVLAAGFPLAIRGKPNGIGLLLVGAGAFLAGLFFTTRVMVPRYAVRKSAFDAGTIAYLDCGHPTAKGACLRGSDLEPHFLYGRPDPPYTATVDAERVEYEIGGLEASLPMRLEVVYASADPTYDDSWVGDSEPDVRHVVQRLRAGEAIVHGPIAVTHLATTYSFRLPPAAIADGRMRLSFEKLAGLYATVSEIRIRRDPVSVAASFVKGAPGRGEVRVEVKGPEPVPGRMLYGWFAPAEAPERVSDAHRHLAGAASIVQPIPVPSERPGRWRFSAILVDPERSPFAVVEAESVPHPGWRTFGAPRASGRYMVRATEGWTRAGASVRVDLSEVPAGRYDARVRYAAPGGEAAGTAFGAPLKGSRDRWVDAASSLEAESGTLSGEISFGGRGRLAVDRISFVPVAGAFVTPDVTIEFDLP